MPAEVSLEDPQSFWSNFVRPRVAHMQNVSPFDAADLVSDARQALDDELAAMHLAMCALRTRRNALAPISRLPSEVLARIFEHHAAMEPPFPYMQLPLGWIHNTHVCRHWRLTALQQPYLWRPVHSFLSPEWQGLFLDRAKSLPVTFYHRNDELPISSRVAKHLFHIRVLRLRAGIMSLQQVLPTLTSSASLLESFDVFCSNDLSVTAPAPVLPLNVLNGHSPRLRQLGLDNVLIPWSAPILKGLTLLAVRCDEAEASNGIPTTISRHDHLIEALQKMPALETLTLEHCLPPRLPSSATDEIVYLRRLKILGMDDISDRCTGILKHLRVPSYCRLSLDMKGPADIDDILPFLHAYAAGGRGKAPFQTLVLVFNDGNFTLAISRAYMEAEKMNFFQLDSNYHMRLHFIQSGQSPDLVQRLCSALLLESLRSLSIHNSPPAWSSQNWVDTFGRCTALETVLLDGRNVVHYWGELLQPGYAPLLSLRTLSLTGLNFHDDIVHGSGGVSVFHRAFLAWLTARKETGPLFKLIIKNCRVTEAYVTELKQILEVEWK